MPAMQGILELLRPDSLLLQQDIKSQKRALEVLSVALAEGMESGDARVLLDLLTARERLGSTGLGQGIAIPHCRVPDATQSAATILTLVEPVDFGALDNRPVDLFVALAVPSLAEDLHLQYLRELATILSNLQKVKVLRTSRDPEALIATLSQA